MSSAPKRLEEGYGLRLGPGSWTGSSSTPVPTPPAVAAKAVPPSAALGTATSLAGLPPATSKQASPYLSWKYLASVLPRQVKERIRMSRSRNPEIGEAGNLMEYLIGIVGWWTGTERYPVWRATITCALVTGASVALAMRVEHKMAEALAGWLMGLAWDSMWHGFISPQQKQDAARRIWEPEYERLWSALNVDSLVEPDIDLNLLGVFIDSSSDGALKPSTHAAYGKFVHKPNLISDRLAWRHRVDFCLSTTEAAETLAAARSPGADLVDNPWCEAVRYTRADGVQVLRFIAFKWSEKPLHSGLSETQHRVTRENMQVVFETLVRSSHEVWFHFVDLRDALRAAPAPLRQSAYWMDGARAAVEILDIANLFFRAAVRFAAAVHRVADLEDMREILPDGPTPLPPFEDHFLHPGAHRDPYPHLAHLKAKDRLFLPGVNKWWVAWLFQATEYVGANAGTTGVLNTTQRRAMHTASIHIPLVEGLVPKGQRKCEMNFEESLAHTRVEYQID